MQKNILSYKNLISYISIVLDFEKNVYIQEQTLEHFNKLIDSLGISKKIILPQKKINEVSPRRFVFGHSIICIVNKNNYEKYIKDYETELETYCISIEEDKKRVNQELEGKRYIIFEKKSLHNKYIQTKQRLEEIYAYNILERI